MRRLLSATVVAAALVTVGLAPTPAYAVPDTPVISGLDSSTPGVVTGTVASDQPYVFLRLSTAVPSTRFDLAGGSASFQLTTWGYGGATNTATIIGVACPDLTGAGCSTTDAELASFTPTDIAPSATYTPADGKVGSGEDLTVTIADPQGGGDLRARWVKTVGDGGYGVGETHLNRDGTTTLNGPTTAEDEGAGHIQLVRCVGPASLACKPIDLAPQFAVEVHRHLTARADSGTPTTAAHPTSTVHVDTDRVGPVTLGQVRLVNVENNVDLAVPVTDVDASTDGNGDFSFSFDTTGLPDNAYSILASPTVADATFGALSGPLREPFGEAPLVYVDLTVPIVTSAKASPAKIYPNIIGSSGYPSATTISFTGSFNEGIAAEVRSSNGTVVAHPNVGHTETEASIWWEGRDDNYAVVPSGAYTVVLVDGYGNASAVVGRVSVDTRQLYTQTFQRTVRARSSQVYQQAGRCSTVRAPATRGWRGSISLQSNTKCRRGFNASLVITAHHVRLPAATRYLSARVTVYGGAARRAGGSRAQLSYLKGSSRQITTPTWIGPGVGRHAGPRHSARELVLKDGATNHLVWYVVTGGGARYDLKSFTVTVSYQVLA